MREATRDRLLGILVNAVSDKGPSKLRDDLYEMHRIVREEPVTDDAPAPASGLPAGFIRTTKGGFNPGHITTIEAEPTGYGPGSLLATFNNGMEWLFVGEEAEKLRSLLLAYLKDPVREPVISGGMEGAIE